MQILLFSSRLNKSVNAHPSVLEGVALTRS